MYDNVRFTFQVYREPTSPFPPSRALIVLWHDPFLIDCSALLPSKATPSCESASAPRALNDKSDRPSLTSLCSQKAVDTVYNLK